ncbi:MAG: DUF485 domain-containing protein [Akkermansiaceae bacterium]|jgi:uncharacterized membrane protein (DUF485 family)|nr:DUF485 domain-containing protein [Akkermansiaceae bacterium]
MKPTKPEEWEALARLPAFHDLLAAKRRFIIPATIFFLLYYMALPVLIGYFPELMKRPFIGKVNGAYAFAFSQFLMTFVLAWLYMRQARRWDAMEHALLESIENPSGK